MNILRTIAAAVILCFFCGCAVSMENAGGVGSAEHAGKARVLVYLHVKDGKRPPLLSFTLAVSGLKKSGGQQVALSGKSMTVNAAELFGNQALLGEFFVEPGSFDSVDVGVTAASLAGADVFSKLPGTKTYALPVGFSLSSKDSFVINIEWDAVASVVSSQAVELSMSASAQHPLASNLMLFVSNEGSDYVSVVDVDKERVVGAVSVGKAPTSIALSESGFDVYVLNSGDGTVSVVDTVSLRVRETILLVGGVGAREMVYVKSGAGYAGEKLYIINEVSRDVSVINARTGLFIKKLPVGGVPAAIAASGERKEVYVALPQLNEISVIGGANDDVVAAVRVSLQPRGLVVDGDGLYAFDDSGRSIATVSLSGRVETNVVSTMQSLIRGIKAFGGRLFAADSINGDVVFFSQVNNVATNSLNVGKGIFNMAADEIRNRLYVTGRSTGAVYVVDASTQRVVKTLPVGDKPFGMARFK